MAGGGQGGDRPAGTPPDGGRRADVTLNPITPRGPGRNRAGSPRRGTASGVRGTGRRNYTAGGRFTQPSRPLGSRNGARADRRPIATTPRLRGGGNVVAAAVAIQADGVGHGLDDALLLGGGHLREDRQGQHLGGGPFGFRE